MQKFTKITFATLLLITFIGALVAQTPKDWYLKDASSGYPGISVEKAYDELLKNRQSKEVIVAIIDSGVDADHEDLADVMWVNKDEIPGNGIDDDKNGYIDDVNGWNFLGNAKGENVHYDNLEGTRIYAKLSKKFEGVSVTDVKKKDKKDYELYQELKEGIEEKQAEYEETFMVYGMLLKALDGLESELGENPTEEQINAYETDNPLLQNVIGFMQAESFAKGETYQDFRNTIESDYEQINGYANYYFNPDINTREIVGDNYSDSYEKGYGNNNVEGPDAMHGTHVAGIVAAIRNNKIGAQGVADNVKIMAVRAVPAGDERDKDVANAILYAVDNGAKVINMSFGKSYPWDKKAVDKAVKYALKKDVLLVHGAGNDGSEIDPSSNYPNDRFKKRGLFGPRWAKNWIEVGASSYEGGDMLCADFSNYSSEYVDVFAPGVEIYSTVPNDGYKFLQGTSMASPVVAGLAALLRSYFPDLSAKEVREVILESAQPVTEKVKDPSRENEVSFNSLCKTGAVIDAYEAVKLAMKK